MTQYFRFQANGLDTRNRHPHDFEREIEVLSRHRIQAKRMIPPARTSLEAGYEAPIFSAFLGYHGTIWASMGFHLPNRGEQAHIHKLLSLTKG
jgi:hypothetical protein